MPATYHLTDLVDADAPDMRVMTAYHTTNDRHDHDFYELVYVTEGFCLHDSRGSVTLLMEGDVFILKPWVSHKYIGNRVTAIYNCIFGGGAVRESLKDLCVLPGLDLLFSPDPTVSAPRLHLSLTERKSFLRMLEWMREEYEARPAGWQVRLRSLLNCLLVAYSRAYIGHVGAGAEQGGYSAYVAGALNTIDKGFADPGLTVGRIAAEAGVSADYLSRQFRASLGIATQEYLRRYRFARAMELLQAGVPVGDVALQVGFSSLSHFSREFKREMGITPSQYRVES